MSSAAYLIKKAFKQLQYINGQQDGETPSIERAAMSALRDLRNALREMGEQIPSPRYSFEPHAHAHGRRGAGSGAIHRDARRSSRK